MENAPELPRLNELAPNFEAKNTQGMCKLADYEGKWLIILASRRLHASLHHGVHSEPSPKFIRSFTSLIVNSADARADEGYDYTDWYFSCLRRRYEKGALKGSVS